MAWIMTTQQIDDVASALRSHDTVGRFTVEWERVPNGQKKKWREKAVVALRAAGLSPAALKEVPAEWTAPVDTDRKIAWTGAYPDQPAVPLRIEAASFRGKVVFFSIVAPWRKPPEPG